MKSKKTSKTKVSVRKITDGKLTFMKSERYFSIESVDDFLKNVRYFSMKKRPLF